MHGQINLKDIPYFKDKVKDQQLIRIKGFVVKSYRGGFRPIPGTRKLYVNAFTSIVVIQEDGQQIPRYKFVLAEFASLREKLGQRTDLIGNVHASRVYITCTTIYTNVNT